MFTLLHTDQFYTCYVGLSVSWLTAPLTSVHFLGNSEFLNGLSLRCQPTPTLLHFHLTVFTPGAHISCFKAPTAETFGNAADSFLVENFRVAFESGQQEAAVCPFLIRHVHFNAYQCEELLEENRPHVPRASTSVLNSTWTT